MCWNYLAKKAWASNMKYDSHKLQHLKHHFASNFPQHIVGSWDLTITRAGAQWGLKPGGPAAARLLINQLSPPAEIWRSPRRVLPIGRLLPDLRSNHLSCLHLLQVTFPDPKTSHGHNVVTRCCRLQGDWFLLLAVKSICRIFLGGWEGWTRSSGTHWSWQASEACRGFEGVNDENLKHLWQIGGKWRERKKRLMDEQLGWVRGCRRWLLEETFNN